MEMYCNNTGCNVHDYAVAPAWCQYLWSQKQADQRQERLLAALTERLDSMARELQAMADGGWDRRSSKAPPSAASPANRGGGTVPT